MDVNALLHRMVEKGASDLHLRVPSPPVLRIDGVLEVQEDLPPVDVKDVEMAFERIATPDQRSMLLKEKDVDFAYSAPGLARFRVNVMRQRGSLSMAVRVVPFQLPTLSDIGAPEICKEMVLEPRGLIMITGPSASGKTTTMAAMINHLNQSVRRNVVILEDPIEYLYSNNKCIIAQRDIGDDAKSLDVALRQAMRHDPDVIVIGAMDGLGVIEMAIRAAESGCLVMMTMNTTGAVDTINQLIDLFPFEQRKTARQRLSQVLLGIISQRLINRASGKGRVAAFEVMVNNPEVRRLICDGKDSQIEEIMQSCNHGMQTMHKAIDELVKKGIIKEEEHPLKAGVQV